MIEINPTTKAQATIIMLHGLGADANDFVPLASQFKLLSPIPIRFVFPNAPMAPVTINNGYVMRAWYDIYSLGLDQRIDEKGIEKSANLVHQLIAREEEIGIPTEKIILAGFSQGAVIALNTGLTYPKKLGGIIALSGYLPFAEKILAQIPAANHQIPVFLAHGTEDTVVPFFLGEMVYQALKQFNIPVMWRFYPMAHSVNEQEVLDIAAWVNNTIS